MEYIAVLGFKLNEGKIDTIMQSRLDKVFELYHQKPNAEIIVSGGDVEGSGISEAEVMRRVLIGGGINESKIHLENNSKNTEENVKNILALLENKEVSTLNMVTSDFHMARTRMLTDHYNNGRLSLKYHSGKTSEKDPRRDSLYKHELKALKYLNELINEELEIL